VKLMTGNSQIKQEPTHYSNILHQQVLINLPLNIRNILDLLDDYTICNLEEIRLRVNRPLIIKLNGQELILNTYGQKTTSMTDAYFLTIEDLDKTVQIITKSSLYAIEEELRNGYITLSGGHRVGFAGEAVIEKGSLKNIKNIRSLNIRFAKEVKGCSDRLFPYLIDQNKQLLNTLILSPPKCGKTTLLRDIVRNCSYGNEYIKPLNVSLVDERSEIAACYGGVAQNDIGPRTDVLDKCPKVEGMMLLLRSMSPDLIVTDEIGSIEDVKMIEQVIHAGVLILTSIHAHNLAELEERPYIRTLLDKKIFKRLIVLSNKFGTGSIEGIFDENKKLLFSNLGR
jgi:stage III sporulation protein AA